MTRKGLSGIFAALFFVSFMLFGATVPDTQSSTTEKESNGDAALQQEASLLHTVVKVIDGDTFDVDMNGRIERIRLIGIDTPESVDPRRPVACFGKEASHRTKQVLEGKRVRLESDSDQDDRDRYGRLLRYAFLEDDTNFNKLMISEGYAQEYTYETRYKYQAEFRRAEQDARNAERGLWGDTACNAGSSPPAPTQNFVTSTRPSLAPMASDRDCSDFNSRAEAQAFFEAQGGPTQDPHRLDGDHDGWACESLR